MERFNKACLDIQNLPTEAAIMGLINSLREGPFSHSISMKHPMSLNEVQERAEKYINMEENSRLGETSKVGFSYSSRDKDKESRKKEDQSTEKSRKYHNYSPLRVSLVDIYREICNTEKIPPPCPIKHKMGRSRTEYCKYHKIYEHPTNECYDLKNIIEKLAREGRSDRFLANRTDEPKKRRRDEEGDRSPDLPIISFTKEDAAGIIPGHDDPVVITIILANANLHRTLVYQGSSADILFKPTFDKLGLQEMKLRAYPNSLFGLGDAPIQPFGYIPLHTTFGKGARSRTLSIDYIVVDVNSAYNALIGRTILNQLAAVVSTPHLCTKFPTLKGIATVKGDQKLARRCYNESLNLKGDPRGKEANAIELGGARTHKELRP
ncbi:uncharacterized protein LOC107489423 [Arachis duranensis]|uniref:Uncharacterized protein LOC107489423 n=1 Tax=Arachis duranensis TaxID=130453 RepID=A0A6P4DEC1_ARADU|nr:uncharacterized protein LOC107489423 [Arachis duranensis]